MGFSVPKHPKNLNPSIGLMNQDFGDSFGREKIPSYNQRNKVTHITMTSEDKMVNNNVTECSVSPDCTSSHY